MSHSFFAYVARMRYIDRWGLMRNTMRENVQEHSHMVAVLAHALAVIRREVFHGTVDPNLAAVVALYHDAAELFTGDLPTPVKYDNPVLRDAYKAMEQTAVTRLLAQLPDVLRPTYAPLFTEEDTELVTLVKAADKLSAYLKCVEELKAGNLEFKSAAAQTRAALDALALPELNYFMEQYLPAFSMTLDELQEKCNKEGSESLCAQL